MKCFDKSILEKLKEKKNEEKQLIALINSGADMYCVHLSFEEKKGDGKEKSYIPTDYQHIQTHIHKHTYYTPRTKALNERTNA